MKRFLGLFLSIFLSISAICGIGLSAFFFDKAKTTAIVDNLEKKVDNIEENYDLAGVSEESNYYTVYFFPQETAYLNINYNAANKTFTYNPTLPNRYFGVNVNGVNQPQNGAMYIPFTERAEHNIFGTITGEDDDKDISGYDLRTFGYWNDNGSQIENVEQDSSNNPLFGWRKITVYRSLSVDEFNGVGSLSTYKNNSDEWNYFFSGWTASIDGVENAIFHQQGDFEYIDAFEALSKIDNSQRFVDNQGESFVFESNGQQQSVQKSIDGSAVGDHIVFLYPIYTIGQDRAQQYRNESQIVSNIRLVDNSLNGSTRYFSQEEKNDYSSYGLENITKYELKNINVTESSLEEGNLILQAQLVERRLSGSYAWGGEDESYVVMNFAQTLFLVPGSYNITIYLSYVPSNENISEDSVRNYGRNDLNSGVITKEWTDHSYSRGTAILNRHKRDYAWYVAIQRSYEFHLLGGPYGTYDYNSANVNRIYPYDFYGYGDDTFVTSTENHPLERFDDSNFSKTFSISGVFVDANGIHATSNHPEAMGRVSSNIFTIGGSNRLWNFPLLAMPKSRLDALNTSLTEDEKFTTISDAGDSILSSVSDSDLDEMNNTTDSSERINKPSMDNFLKINETGIYDFRFEIVFDGDSSEDQNVIDPDSGSIDNIINYVYGIYIAVRRHPANYFVKIFNSKVEAKYNPVINDDGSISRAPDDDGRFVCHYEGALYTAMNLEYGPFNWSDDGEENPIFQDVNDNSLTPFNVINNLSQNYSNGFYLKDNVTDEIVYDSLNADDYPTFNVDKCYVLYVESY